MLGIGYDREWLQPLDADGNRNPELGVEERVVGCHVGPYAGLNLLNPQPGMEYIWMANPSRAGASPADSLAIHQRGGTVVKGEDPEFAAFSKMEGMEASPLDTSVLYRELCLVRIPVERLARERAENAERNNRMLRRGPEDSFVNRASSLESEKYSERGPTRFRLNRHQTEFNHGGDTVEISTPETGIIRTEHVE